MYRVLFWLITMLYRLDNVILQQLDKIATESDPGLPLYVNCPSQGHFNRSMFPRSYQQEHAPKVFSTGACSQGYNSRSMFRK